jgi:pimeloyl-ACP methyl ester carboxylesterase
VPNLPTNGIDLHWESFGEGEPLLWLHGSMGCGADWRYLFADVPAGFQLIAPDLRGHGSTANPSGQFSFRQCADDMLALLDHLGLPAVTAIGLSGGGIVLLHMATRRPSSISSMVVVSAPPYFPEQVRAIQRTCSEATLGADEMARMRQRHKGGEAQLKRLFEMTRAFADSYDDVNFTPPYLGTITADTLIVFGDRDPLYPVSLAFELRQSIPRSSLWVVPGGGHGPVFGDRSPQFVATALGFLRGESR